MTHSSSVAFRRAVVEFDADGVGEGATTYEATYEFATREPRQRACLAIRDVCWDINSSFGLTCEISVGGCDASLTMLRCRQAPAVSRCLPAWCWRCCPPALAPAWGAVAFWWRRACQESSGFTRRILFLLVQAVDCARS
jgi:hypothetical protein